MPKRWQVAVWGYRWSGDYGSRRYSVDNPNRRGQDERTVAGQGEAGDE